MDCDCHQTAHTDQRSQLKNMTIVLSMDCCFCESSCNFRFSEASSTSSSSFSRSFLSPHPSALFQPFFILSCRKDGSVFLETFCCCYVSLFLPTTTKRAHLPLLMKLQMQKHSSSLSLCDGWRPAFVLCGRLSHTDTAWDSTGLTETDTSLLSLFVFLCQSSWAASMTVGSLRGVCWQLDSCCGQRVRTFTMKTNHRLTTVWLHRPKLLCEWISAEFSRVKDASVASDLKQRK